MIKELKVALWRTEKLEKLHDCVKRKIGNGKHSVSTNLPLFTFSRNIVLNDLLMFYWHDVIFCWILISLFLSLCYSLVAPVTLTLHRCPVLSLFPLLGFVFVCNRCLFQLQLYFSNVVCWFRPCCGLLYTCKWPVQVVLMWSNGLVFSSTLISVFFIDFQCFGVVYQISLLLLVDNCFEFFCCCSFAVSKWRARSFFPTLWQADLPSVYVCLCVYVYTNSEEQTEQLVFLNKRALKWCLF